MEFPDAKFYGMTSFDDLLRFKIAQYLKSEQKKEGLQRYRETSFLSVTRKKN